jgi:hypothetical protein
MGQRRKERNRSKKIRPCGVLISRSKLQIALPTSLRSLEIPLPSRLHNTLLTPLNISSKEDLRSKYRPCFGE